MANLWVVFGQIADENAADAKMKLLMMSKNLPEGVVLDLGAGKSVQILIWKAKWMLTPSCQALDTVSST